MATFFISYTDSDRPWALWLVWFLESKGFTTFARYKDIRWGQNREVRIDEALRDASRFILVLSPDYISSPDGRKEWTTVTQRDPDSSLGLLLPVKVGRDFDSGILGTTSSLDLADLDEAAATALLVEALDQLPPEIGNRQSGGTAPNGKPPFPYDNRDFLIEYCDTEADRVKELTLSLTARGRKVFQDLWKISEEITARKSVIPASVRAKCRVVCVGGKTPSMWAHERIKEALNAERGGQMARFLPILFPGAPENLKKDFDQVLVWADAENATEQLEGAASGNPVARAEKAPVSRTTVKAFIADLREFGVKENVREDYERFAIEEYWKDLRAPSTR